MMRSAPHAASGGLADRGADADIARGHVLRPGKCFRDQAAVLDERWAASRLQELQRRVDFPNGLTGDYQIVVRHFARKIVGRLFKRQVVRRAVDGYGERCQLFMGLLWHPNFPKADNNFEAVTLGIEMAREEAHLRFLTADNQPGKYEQDAPRFP